MLDIVILERNVENALKLMNNISKTFKEYRVIYISKDEKDFKEYIKGNLFDLVIMEEFFIDKCPEIFNYNVIKICLLDNYRQSTKFISVRRTSEKVLYDYLTKILIYNADSVNKKVRKAIRDELEYLGFNFSLKGTRYLEDAINLIYFKNYDGNLEKEVFSQLAKTYSKTSHNIKVNIQNATNTMLEINGYERLLEYLCIDSKYGVGSKAIICAIINKVKGKLKNNNTSI